MAMAAWHLKAGLTADCTSLCVKDGELLQTRPAFGNNIMAQIRTVSPIQMATVRPDTFRASPCPAANPAFFAESFTDDTTRVTIEETVPYGNAMPLGQADIILAGGLGIGSAEGFAKLAAFAEKIGAAVAASRGAVDAGFAPYRCQVGMTGVTVGPKLYIAVGISGAVQHLSGMSGSDTVIAINTDPKAPIFDYADYGIVGDWESVIQKALEELQ
jgi:electron transfer flavoprotein alpha subunit